jgi:tetratricopeptide (TPR) repeat protein
VETDASSFSSDTSLRLVSGADIDALLALALSQPQRAQAIAADILARTPTSREASIAHQVLAIVERDAGHLMTAVESARQALRYARRTDDDRVADVLATLGATLVYAGRTAAGLRRLAEAEPLTASEQRPRLEQRRAVIWYVTGHYDTALHDADAAIAGNRQLHDDLWVARGLTTRSLILLALGDVGAADADAAEAEILFSAVGQQLESAYATHNRAVAAHQAGDLVRALDLMNAVIDRYTEIGTVPNDLVIDHAQMLLTAGLVGEAMDITRAALSTSDLQPVKRAEVLLTAAQAALADRDLDAAQKDGDQAGWLFAAQQRPAWAHRARLLSLQAQYLAEHPDHQDITLSPLDPRTAGLEQRQRQRRLLRASVKLVEQMRAERSSDLVVAQLLHGRIAHDARRDDEARRSFEQAARSRHSGSGLARAAGWLAAALLADLKHDRRALLHACRRGLDSVDEYRALLGDLELRALATKHGNEFMTLAMRSAQERKDARGMLWWIERWRATALAVPRARPSRDQELDRQIAALRDVARRLDAAEGAAREALQRERDQLEAKVRRSQRTQRTDGMRAPSFDAKRIRDTLGDTVLLVLVTLDGCLSAITVADGRVRRRPVGRLADALKEARFARFALRRTAFGRVADIPAVGMRLQHALLGEPSPAWSRPNVVVVPTADLLTAPWGLLPAFADTTLTISPSATLWAAARGRARRQSHIALVTGPGLSTGENEVTTLSPLHDQGRAIGGEAATVAGALEVLDGARLAHVAAHGTFRADAPMFSSLMMYDGPLTVHDLDRLERPPAQMVLSACDSGNSAPIGAHEALGLVSSLLAMGTATVLASVVPVNDRATVGVMRTVHDVVGSGGSLAEGWLAARQTADDPLSKATAAAFTAWGA